MKHEATNSSKVVFIDAFLSGLLSVLSSFLSLLIFHQCQFIYQNYSNNMRATSIFNLGRIH